MIKAYKSWSQYSIKWRRQRLKEGFIPRRWNRYRHLSAKTRAKTDPYEYAKGKSVKFQARSKLLDNLTVRVHKIAVVKTPENFADKFVPAGMATIRYRLDKFSDSELRKYNSIDTDVKLYYQIVEANHQAMDENDMSPLYYHAGGTR